jgi:hypothetical protein
MKRMSREPAFSRRTSIAACHSARRAQEPGEARRPGSIQLSKAGASTGASAVLASALSPDATECGRADWVICVSSWVAGGLLALAVMPRGRHLAQAQWR